MRLAPWFKPQPFRKQVTNGSSRTSSTSKRIGHAGKTINKDRTVVGCFPPKPPKLSWQKLLMCNKLRESVVLRNVLAKNLRVDEPFLEDHFSSLSSLGSPMPVCRQKQGQSQEFRPHPLSRCNGRFPKGHIFKNRYGISRSTEKEDSPSVLNPKHFHTASRRLPIHGN